MKPRAVQPRAADSDDVVGADGADDASGVGRAMMMMSTRKVMTESSSSTRVDVHHVNQEEDR